MSDHDQSSRSQQDAGLDDLDAFLDDFGKDAVRVDLSGAAAQGEPPIIAMVDDVSQDDVDNQADAELPELSVADALSEFAPESAADSEEFTAAPAPFSPDVPADDFDDFDDFPPDPVPPASVRAATAQEGINIMAAEDEAPVTAKRGLDVSIGGLALFSLLMAAGAFWYAMSLQGQLTELRSTLAQPRQPVGFAAAPDLQMQEEVGRLGQRLNELTQQIQAPGAAPTATSPQELADVMNRMDGLDRALTDLREELATLQRSSKAVTPSVKAEAPKAQSKTPAPKATATTASKSGRSGSWVVNVASLTDAKAAAAEQQRLKKEGIDVEVQEVEMSGRTWYRVRATGFASRQEAQVYGDILREHVKTTPWVGQQ